MQKLKKDIITILFFIAPLILYSISLQSYWYQIKFANNEIYSFRYKNIKIDNFIYTETSINSNSNNNNGSEYDDIFKFISYGDANNTENVMLVCLTCTIISLACGSIILLLQFVNLKIQSKHNSFLMEILSKVIGLIMISFNIGSVLYLLSFMSNFNKECKLLGNCLPGIYNNNNSSTIITTTTPPTTGLNSIEFIGSTSTTFYRPHLSWLLNIIAFIFIIGGLIMLFVKKDKIIKPHRYHLLV